MVRMVLKRILPEPIFSAYHAVKRSVSNLFMTPEAVFTEIYQGGGWKNEESVSGHGSALDATEYLREALPPLLRQLQIKTMIDAPCGDLNWMRAVDLPVDRYIGIDVVPPLIEHNQKNYANDQREFQVADITKQKLLKADLIICRDCLIHLSFKQIHATIANFKESGSTYLLTTHNPLLQRNKDIVTGSFRRLNLEKAPFSFPPPLQLIQDGPRLVDVPPNPDRVMGLWKLADLL